MGFRKKHSSVFATFLVFAMMHLSLAGVFAEAPPPGIEVEDSDKPRLAVRVFDFDRDTPLKRTPARIIHTGTGQPKDDQTNNRGCVDFGQVQPGAFSLTVKHEDKEYLLQEKIPVEQEQKVLVCVAVSEAGALVPVPDESCECKEFPFAWLVFGAGLVPIGFISEDDEEVSPSTP